MERYGPLGEPFDALLFDLQTARSVEAEEAILQANAMMREPEPE